MKLALAMGIALLQSTVIASHLDKSFPSKPSQSPKDICLIISYFDNPDEPEGAREDNQRVANLANQERIAKWFSNTDFYIQHKPSIQSVNRLVRSYTSLGGKVKCLILDSHGDPDVIFLEDQEVHLSDSGSVKTFFGEFVGHFSHDARIIFHGCNVLAGGDDSDRSRRIAAFAKNFGLSSGIMYANATTGSDYRNKIITSAFSNGQVDWKKLIFQTLSPVTYPEALIYEWLFHNRGYVLRADNGHFTITKGRLEDAYDQR